MHFIFRVLSAILYHPSAAGILTYQTFPFTLGNLMVHVLGHGRRHEPFSTRNLQAMPFKHSGLTGQFIPFQTNTFCQQFCLTTCRSIFVLQAIHMSRDELFSKSLPPLPKFSIRVTTCLTTSVHLVTRQSSTVTLSTHTVFKPVRSQPHFSSCLLLLSSA